MGMYVWFVGVHDCSRVGLLVRLFICSPVFVRLIVCVFIIFVVFFCSVDMRLCCYSFLGLRVCLCLCWFVALFD